MPKSKKETPASPKKRQVFQSVKGMHDILPKDHDWWQSLFEAGFAVAELHDFNYIETPILEQAALFEAGVGAATDIVEKEMFIFKTKGGERVALRPEGTASVMRSYLEHHLGYFASPLKVFYYGPMFRYERPQKGRYREHHQWGFEILSDGDAVYDAEMILAALDFLGALKLKDLVLKINAVGCRVCRPTYRARLKDYYRRHKSKLCKDCERRYEGNILRLLDCKEPQCLELKKNAPIILNFLCSSCNSHFRSVLELIEDNDIPYESDPFLVRGLDYYNKTVFEIFSPKLPDISLAGGGRYDYLSEILGGRPMPAVGVALGMERIIEAMQASGLPPAVKNKRKIFFIAIGEEAKKASLKFISSLRRAGVKTLESLGKKSLKAQLKMADKQKAKFAVIVGQKEIFEGSAIIRDMETGAQETVTVDKLVETVKKNLR
ncbi:MAG: histidine--tRNA ligase [Candidatus Brennerbacteria bacterium]|nr:histidine--tRNA ligase [Candidatus Brennerbacteria bacterium]